MDNKFLLQSLKFWRLLLVVILIQLTGGLTFSMVNLFNNLIINMWFGGCFLTPFGFIAGYYWHQKKSPPVVTDKNLIYAMAMICLLIFLSSIVFIKFYYFNSWMMSLAMISEMKQNSIHYKNIIFYRNIFLVGILIFFLGGSILNRTSFPFVGTILIYSGWIGSMIGAILCFINIIKWKNEKCS